MKPYAKAQLQPLEGLKDRRRVLTDEQKEQIKEIYAKGGIGTRPLARMFHCSRSLVRRIVDPQLVQRDKDRFKSNWRKYYEKHGKEYHARAIRNTRNYKYALYTVATLQKCG